MAPGQQIKFARSPILGVARDTMWFVGKHAPAFQVRVGISFPHPPPEDWLWGYAPAHTGENWPGCELAISVRPP